MYRVDDILSLQRKESGVRSDVQTFHGDSVSPWRHLSLLQFSRVDENGMTLESAAVSECTLLQKKVCGDLQGHEYLSSDVAHTAGARGHTL